MRPAAAFAVGSPRLSRGGRLCSRGSLGPAGVIATSIALGRTPARSLTRRAGAAPLGARPSEMLCSVCSYKSAAGGAETRRSACHARLPSAGRTRSRSRVCRPGPTPGARRPPDTHALRSPPPSPARVVPPTEARCRAAECPARLPPRGVARLRPGSRMDRFERFGVCHARSESADAPQQADSTEGRPRSSPAHSICPSASARSHRDEDEASLCARERSCSRRNSRIRFAKTPPRDDLIDTLRDPLVGVAPVRAGRLRAIAFVAER